jgi:nucleoside-diphosphate-sugar epimerase
MDDLHGCDAVIHLAALSNDPMGAFAPDITYDINYTSSVRLAELARKNGVKRFIFASSCSIYGAAGDACVALDEGAEFNPVSAYAVSKVRTEIALRELANDSFCPVYMRNATAYGLAPRVRFDLVFNNLVAAAYTTGVIKVLSDGTPWRPLVHVRDIAAAAVAAMEAPREAVWNEAFNVGRSDANYQVRDIAEIVARSVPGSAIEVTGESGGDPRSYQVNFTKILTSLPNYTPEWTLERSANEFAVWFEHGGAGDHDVFSRMFIRLEQLKALTSAGRLDKRLRVSGDLNLPW